MQIFIKTPMRTHVLEVEPEDTVEMIREMVEQKERDAGNASPTLFFRFIFQGKQMEDGRTLQDYNIRKEGTVHAVVPCMAPRHLLREQGEEEEKKGQDGE